MLPYSVAALQGLALQVLDSSCRVCQSGRLRAMRIAGGIGPCRRPWTTRCGAGGRRALLCAQGAYQNRQAPNAQHAGNLQLPHASCA